MNPYAAYRKQESVGWTRIDMVLTLVDEALARIDRALEAQARGDAVAATQFLVKARLAVFGLASGINPAGGETSVNLLRLYEFAQDALGDGSPDKVRGARDVLTTLREGFQQVRPDALQLERSGAIAPTEDQPTFSAVV
jgi:flagellin-specific chaperone FliS